jgi:signal transduction histidine kinase
MRFSLATRISAAVIGVVALALATSFVAFYTTWKINRLLSTTVNENLPSVRAAEELEIALLEQRGRVGSYILDEGNREWLEELPELEQEFHDWIEAARATANTTKEERILNKLEKVYGQYRAQRARVIALYDAGDASQARQVLLNDVYELYQAAYELCEAFIDANFQYVSKSTASATYQMHRAAWLTGLAIAITVALGLLLLWLFFAGVLFPLRRMIADAKTFAGERPSSGGDELHAVGDYLRTLMSDVAATRSSLEENRAKLSSAEKLASVGRLAAGVAHEIRNPLTAIKMWLFSIRGGVVGDPELDRKLGIVSEEINRLEHIVHDFLEFSRPAPLKLARHDLGSIVGTTLDLLCCRFEDAGIRLSKHRTQEPVLVMADPEQLRQVLINLVNNAIEATPPGGEIGIEIGIESLDQSQPMGVVRIRDTGAGMPEDVRDQIFDPFFTTKEGGTGLGLSIAAQVMARHQGRLLLESTSDGGTTFSIWVPLVEERR